MIGTIESPTRANQLLRIAAPASSSTQSGQAAGAPPAQVTGSALKDAYQKGLDFAQGSIYSNHAIPSFLYPSVFGTAAEKALIMQELDSLPLRDITQATQIMMHDSLDNGVGNLLGATRPAIMTVDITRNGLTEASPLHPLPESAGSTRYTLVHELGHTQDYAGGLPHMLIGGHSAHSAPWGKGPFVSDYASTASPEDFAESHAWYHLQAGDIKAAYPDAKVTSLKEINPAKYADMEKFSQPNAFETFVSQKAFRDTGRYVGEALAFVPYLRVGLNLVGSISVMSLATNGAQQLISGISKSDTATAVDGALDTAGGAALCFSFASPLLGPAALLCLGAHKGLDKARGANATSGQTAAAMTGGAVGGCIGGIGGPIGGTMAGYAVGGPLGGAIGMVAGGLLGFELGSRLGTKAGLKLSGAAKH